MFKASLVTRIVPMPSLEELPTLLKTSLGFVHFTVGYEHRTATNLEDTGVGSVIGMSMFDSPLVILKSRRLSTRAVDWGSRSFPNKVSATQPVED